MQTLKALKSGLHPKGSALLIALLVMGVLMVITLGLSDLVIREIRIQADVKKSGQAYYAAESAIEKALYDVRQGLPGVEKDVKDPELNDAEYSYSIKGKAKTIPDIDSEAVDLASLPDYAKEGFKPLLWNETVNIPLFVADGKGSVTPVKDFYVAYYMDPFVLNLKKQNAQDNFDLNDFDVLRWKVFGINQNFNKTESISDFLSVSDVNSAQTPRCFGTSVDNQVCTSSANPIPADAKPLDEVPLPAVCSTIQARTYYEYDSQGDLMQIHDTCYSIKTFVEDHNFNYLSLTNAANPLMIKNQDGSEKVLPVKERENLSTIYYKVVAVGKDDFLPLNEVLIKARGIFAGLTQDIEVRISREQFLPVFNFALYQAK